MKQTQNKEKLKISKKENQNVVENRWKSVFYTGIFAFLCICDQRRGSAPGHTQLMFVNLSWAAVLLLHFTAIRFREFLKIPYGLFTGLCIAGTVVSGFYRRGDLFFERYFVGQWYAGCLVAWLIGIFLMHGIGELIHGKAKERTAGTSAFLQGIFYLAMIVAYVLNKDLWPVLMILIFGQLYYFDRSEEDKECLLNNLSNGIILAFFLIQSQAFVFRPFDTLRYNGMYANPNMNGLFYMLVYCACLSKYCYYYTKREGVKILGPESGNGAVKEAGKEIGKEIEKATGKKIGKEIEKATGKRINKETWIRWFFLFLGASLWAFTLFTQCRSALMGMAATTAVAGIYCLMMRRTKVIKNGICMVGGLLLCIAITLPISYLAVRYLPPFFHHPIWFEGEYSEEKVHSWDPYDSPKFTNYQQIIESFTGRLHDANGQSVVVEIQAPAGGRDVALQTPAEEGGVVMQTSAEEGGVAMQTPVGGSESVLTEEATTSVELVEDAVVEATTEDTMESDIATETEDTMESDIATETEDTMKADIATVVVDTLEATTDKPVPVFDYEEENSLKIRKAIYSHYLSKLRLRGHKEEENGLQITPNYFAPHAHNLFLQIAFSFGIITGVLFLCWVLLTLVLLAKQAFKDRKRIDPFLFDLAIVLFGVMEIMWRTGQLSIALLFILPMFVKAKQKKTK